MRKSGYLYAVLFIFAVGSVFAQNVDREELEKNQAAVNFINYEGPHSRIDTVEQIRNIGYQLGLSVKNGASSAGANNRYFVIHSVSAPDGDRLDADIFGIGVDAAVDHIRNLRLIIQGYLQGAYDYSAGDAALLARYVTIYNAVFRGDWNFYSNRYKVPVVENLTSEKAGVSVRFDEWPGQTLMTIPLGTGAPGSLSAIDTSSLTDQQVTDQMRRDGGGIEDRQGMVDLKEREADEATQSATLQREAIAEEEKDIERDREETTAQRQRVEQEQRRTEQQRQEAQQQQQQAQRDAEAGRISQQEAQRRQQEAQRQEQEARRRQQELDRQQEENRQREAEIAQREQAQEQRRQEAAATEARAEQKTGEAQQEREEIARDQQALIEGRDIASADTGSGSGAPGAGAAQAGAVSPAAANNLLAISILSANSPLGRLVRVNPQTGAITQSSQMNTVNGRTVTLVGGRILAVAGIDRGNGAIRLVEINSDTLEMAAQGSDDIHSQSLLWNNGNDLYAVVTTGGKNYLARFNMNLEKQSQTAVEVHSYAGCVFQGDRILTQKADGTPLLVNAQTLR
ncbi:MAG: hypothetical protein LBH35_09550 [Treponema sp.]|jgi:multidrug efflux pump subunit AcrA (membrane-fusion protein)|nr:hypothetical protein [Treponema sp.]